MNKAIKAIAALLVLAIIAGGIGWLSDGFTNWDVKEWFQKYNADTVVFDKDGNQMVSDKVYPIGDMVFTAPTTSMPDGITLNATISPSSATNKAVDWSIRFQNPDSAFAAGKSVTDYVTITPSADGSTTAVVRCVAAFGEPIVITCTSRDNPNAKSECAVDYARRVIGAVWKCGNLDLNTSPDSSARTEFKFNLNPDGDTVGGDFSVEYILSDVYTIDDTFRTVVKPIGELPWEFDNKESFKLNGHAITNLGYNHFFEISRMTFNRSDVNKFYIDSRDGGTRFADLSTEQIIGYFTTITDPHYTNLQLDVVGTYSTYTCYTKLYCTGYTQDARVAGVSIGFNRVVL